MPIGGKLREQFIAELLQLMLHGLLEPGTIPFSATIFQYLRSPNDLKMALVDYMEYLVLRQTDNNKSLFVNANAFF